MPDPVLVDPITAAITALVGQSPLVGLAALWWIKYGRKVGKDIEPEPVKVGAETACSFRVTHQGQIERIDSAVTDVIPKIMETHAQILRDINATQQQMSIALATIASSNKSLHETAIADTVRLQRIEQDASDALKYSQWVQEGKR